jgi:hypothetical protein
MPSGVVTVTTIASMDFPCLFTQPGLVKPYHQVQVMKNLQNCKDEDITIPRCSNIGYIENVKTLHFDIISEVHSNERAVKVRA